MRETGTPSSYDPLQRLREGDWRARTPSDQGGCLECEGYGSDDLGPCPSCDGTGHAA